MHVPDRWSRIATAGTLAATLAACAPEPANAPSTTAVYSRTTGRLEQLVSDEDGDGTPEARAFMDGTALTRIELDRDANGQPDRWEYYEPAPAGAAHVADPAAGTRIVRAEEAHGGDGTVTRREFFEAGVLTRVEEDTDLDGRVDKWETYAANVLTRVDLDLSGRGHADRRLVYGPAGEMLSVEADSDGDGRFEPVSAAETGTGGTTP